MSDRFKFRCWDANRKLMLLPETSDDVGRDEWYAGEWEVFNDSLKLVQEGGWTLMQCTGLRDKNGKLIFGGDILQELVGPDKEERLHSVEWAGNMWDVRGIKGGLVGWMYDDGFAQGDHGYFHFEETEIIGNIYETPELLKESKDG